MNIQEDLQLIKQFYRNRRWSLLAHTAQNHPNATVRRSAATYLSDFATDSTRKVLQHVLHYDSNPDVRRAAAEGLLRLEGPELIEQFTIRIADESLSEDERARLARDLGMLIEVAPDLSCYAALCRRLLPAFHQTRSPLLRARIAWVLSWFDVEEIVSPMLELLKQVSDRPSDHQRILAFLSARGPGS